MARKNIFEQINKASESGPARKASPGYASHGASKSMKTSLSELAEKAARAESVEAGEAIVEIDPQIIDDSFIADRIEDDEKTFGELVDAIRERGQDTPVLLRPHPNSTGRFQTVFGHRRVRAARILNRPVRAVVKPISDIEHVVAQGQENSARENLSFIERATFAQRLGDLGYDRQVVMTALSVDAPMLTRMLSVTSRVPYSLLHAVGAAKSIGRDRWLKFAQQFEFPKCAEMAHETAKETTFQDLPSEARFEALLKAMSDARIGVKKTRPTRVWKAEDESVHAEFKGAGQGYLIALKSKDAGRFGRFITENLDRLHREFIDTIKSGDQ